MFAAARHVGPIIAAELRGRESCMRLFAPDSAGFNGGGVDIVGRWQVAEIRRAETMGRDQRAEEDGGIAVDEQRCPAAGRFLTVCLVFLVGETMLTCGLQLLAGHLQQADPIMYDIIEKVGLARSIIISGRDADMGGGRRKLGKSSSST